MRKIMFNDRFQFTRLVLDGTKTQTRRNYSSNWYTPFKVLETVAIAQRYSTIADNTNLDIKIRQHAHNLWNTCGWDNKMYVKSELMPYRILILDRWVEDIKSISPENCMREGIIREAQGYTFPNHAHYYDTPYDAYEQLIKLLHGKRFWDANPLVQCYEFKLL